jgi:hypothetical protein
MDALAVRKKRFLSEPTIADQLPKSLPGGSKIEEFIGECNGCGNNLPDSMLRGIVSAPVLTVINIDAIGLCKQCMTIFPLSVRMKEYQGQSFLEYSVNGRWVRREFKNETMWNVITRQIVHFVKSILGVR